MKPPKQGRSAKSRALRRTIQPRSDAGAAAVELAIVLPFLLLLVFGIIYFGFIFAAQISLNSSARDAARAGVVKPLAPGAAKTCDQVAQMARKGATTLGLTNPDAIKVTVKSGTSTPCAWAEGVSAITSPDNRQLCTASSDGELVVELEYKMVSPVPLMPPSSVDLKARGAFQCEYS